MEIKLVSMTQPVDSSMSASDLISYCARVSNPANQLNFDTAEKLVRYCMKKGHWSVFEMVDVTFEVKTTRDIGRQILRHRSFSFQEFSQRYATVDVADLEDRELRYQDKTNRQSSVDEKDYSGISEDQKDKNSGAWFKAISDIKNVCSAMYMWAIKNDVAKEQARALLPEGLTPSTMYMKGSLRSWFHYCIVRCRLGTQKEHREIAELVWKELQQQFPFFANLDMQKLATVSELTFEADMVYCTSGITK